jgi:hypothetical protein
VTSERIDRRDELAYRQLRGDTLTVAETDELTVLNAEVLRTWPVPRLPVAIVAPVDEVLAPGHFRWPEKRELMLTYLRERRGPAVAVNADGTEHFNLCIPRGPIDEEDRPLTPRRAVRDVVSAGRSFPVSETFRDKETP